MFVLNNEAKIADLNPAAGALLKEHTFSEVGKDIRDLASDWPEFMNFCSSDSREKEINRYVRQGTRIFNARKDLLYSPAGILEGSLITLNDITVQKKA